MKTIICIGLIWLAGAFVAAWFWHRLRKHEHYMDSLLPRDEHDIFQHGFGDAEKIQMPRKFRVEINLNAGPGVAKYIDDAFTDDATFMGMDKATELTKAQLDRLAEKED